MKTKVVKVLVPEYNKEDEAVQCVGGAQPGGAAAGQGGRTTSHTPTPRRPTGVVVLRSCAVRVPPKKVQLFLEKPKAWCCFTWKKAKLIGTFGFDKQPREDRIHIPVWTSRRSTLDLDRVVRHQDYTKVRITVHLRGGGPANFYTSVDWIMNELVLTANEFVLRLNGRYKDTPREECHRDVVVDDHAATVETEQTDTLEEVPQQTQNNDDDVRSDELTEAAEDKVVLNKETVQDQDEEGDRWRNVVVVGGPLKGSPYQGVGLMGRPDTASTTDQVVDTVLTTVRLVVAAILILCGVALLADVCLGDDFLA